MRSPRRSASARRSTSARRAPASTWTRLRAWARSSCATARRTAERDGIGCAKLVVFCNAVEDNPFMAGAFHGIGEPDCVINVGVSGPGVVLQRDRGGARGRLRRAGRASSSARRSRSRAWASSWGARRRHKLGVPFGIVDLSLAPTPAHGDSVARILEAMGLERVGTHGSTAALALLNDAVKKGGAMASSYVGGLSGRVHPASRRTPAMIDAAAAGRDLVRQARGDDLRLLGGPRHDRGAGRHAAPRRSRRSSPTRPPSA